MAAQKGRTAVEGNPTGVVRPSIRPTGRIKAVLAALAASVVALLSLAGSASAASFGANPASLGAIPDGLAFDCSGSSGVYGADRDVSFTVSGVSLPITNVAVSMTLDPAHTFVGDLSVALKSPDGVGITTIFERTGVTGPTGNGHASNVAGPYTFSDDAPALPSWWEAAAVTGGPAAIPSGAYRASFPGQQATPTPGLSYLLTPAWAGYFAATNANPNGTWILRFRDKCGGETGSVAAATLTLDGTSAPPTATSTGQRAAALKKCKKKKSKKARKKCKKKARRLPV